jgi:ribonucleotide reductase alpha subunit
MNKKDIVVVKRDGTKVPYDVSKIKKSIAFATEGTGVSPLQLEATLDQVVKSGIKTSDIQDNIIQHALQLSSKQEPRWINVAGRALAMQQWGNFKLRDKSFRELVQYNIKKGEYTKDLSIYSPDQLDGLGLKIKMERDLEHSHASLVSTQKKYLGKFELNQHMHMVSSMRFGQMSPEATRLNYVTSLYDDLSQRKISLATPFMSNLRKGGNVSSCFTLAIEDDLDSIYDNIKRVAQISKNGGGVGIFLGYIRARGSEVAGNPNAAGSVLQWIKVINDTLVAVNQGGKRKGAGTVALPIWHNDVLDFFEMQLEHGDLRLKSYDVFPQLVMHDAFMIRDLEQRPWVTFCPFEVKNVLGIDVRGLYGDAFEDAYKKIEKAFDAGKLKVATKYDNARDLMKKAMVPMFETGMPYVAFIDTINKLNPNRDDPETYGILNVNLCVAPETQILTDVGYQQISDLVDRDVNVWNGEQFSPVTVVKTGTNQKLVRVVTTSGQELECTEYHKWYIQENGKVVERRTNELSVGDVLISFNLPDGTPVTENRIALIVDEGRFDDTYCFTEHLRHMGVFNGLLTGQCVESYSNTKPDVYAHVCNLCSINLSNIKDMEELARVSRQACRMLEYGIELTNDPTEITKRHNDRFRTIGIGIMGLHDYLAKRNLSYKNLDVIGEISECIEYNAVLESIELAKQYGAFPAFEFSQWKSGEMTKRFKELGCGKYDWDAAQALIDQYGIRHSQLTSPAPTTTTSLVQDCSSSFLPVFDSFFIEENNNGKMVTAAKFLAKHPLGYAKTLPKFDAKEIIDIAAKLQHHIDTGISMELMFDHNKPDFTAKTVWEAIHYAHQKGIKAIYYIRHIKKNSLAAKEDAACESCAS